MSKTLTFHEKININTKQEMILVDKTSVDLPIFHVVDEIYTIKH